MDLTAGSLGDSAKTKSIFSISVTMSYRIKKKMKTNTFIFLLNFGIQTISLVVIFFCFCLFGVGWAHWPHYAACGILVPRPGIQPVPPAVEA